MATVPLFIGSPRTQVTQLIPAFATRPRIVWQGGASGSVIELITIASTHSAQAQVKFSIGRICTKAELMGVGTLVSGTPDAITRTANSFVADGWRVGQTLVVVGATTVANDFAARLQGVSAQQLTLPAGTVNTAEELPSTAGVAALYNMGLGWSVLVPTGAGTINTTPAVTGLDDTIVPALNAKPDRTLRLDANHVLFAESSVAVDTDTSIDISVTGGDY